MANHDTWENEGGSYGKNASPETLLTLDEITAWINSATKASNPKDALGIMKVPFSTVSAPVIAEVGLAMLEGARKYGRHNYRVIGVRASVYYDAALRHLTAWWEGEDIDPDSGLHHITKAIASLTVVRDAMIQHKYTDDRPPKSPSGWQKSMEEQVKRITAKYPKAVDPYTEIKA